MRKPILVVVLVAAWGSAMARSEPVQRLEMPFKVIWYPPNATKPVYSTFAVLLWNDLAPNTTDNFIKYLQADSYALSLIHRSADTQEGAPFVVQTGGYWASEDADKTLTIHETDSFGTIQNEFNGDTMSNLRGTIAMARTSDLNSASNQWFVNLADNLFLDNPQSPYTVFGQVMTTSGNTGMTLLDSVGQLPTYDFSAATADPSYYALSELPVKNYTQADYNARKPLGLQNLLMIDSIPGQAAWRTMGDMNRDGRVEDYDLVLLQDALNDPWHPYRELGDTNGDGKLNGDDIPALRKLTILGDMNMDGALNALDVADFVKAVSGQQVDYGYKADMNRDQKRNALDVAGFISALINGIRPGGAATVAVPEPATAVLATAWVAWALKRRRQ